MHKPLLGFEIPFPIYWVMMGLAFVVALAVLNGTMKKQAFSKFVRRKIRNIFTVSAVCGLAAANLANWFIFEDLKNQSIYYCVTQGGYTSFFGILCFFAVAALLLRINKLSVKYCINLMIPSVLFAQIIARIGCSLRGCCWGIDVSVFGLTFPLPIRELEAIFALVLLIVLWKRFFIKRFPIYLFSLSVFRFVSEFFRGDERGSLFGITALTPTQIAAIGVIVVTGLVLFAVPILKALKLEVVINYFTTKYELVSNKFSSVFKRKDSQPYEPRSFDYEPARKHTALRVISTLLVVALLIGGLLVYFNPLGIPAVDELRYNFIDTFSFLFAAGSSKYEVGQTNGIALLDISEFGQIKNAEDAKKALQTVDSWAELDFSFSRTERLANGDQMYVFDQVIDGKRVLGKSRVLLANQEQQALCVVGDAAALTFGTKKNSKFQPTMPTVKDAFGTDVSVIEQIECLYDTGNGVVDAYHVILSDDGKTPVLGAVIHKATGKIICFTPPRLGSLGTTESTGIHTANGKVLALLQGGNDDQIKELAKNEKVNALEQNQRQVEQALCKAINSADLEADVFAEVLESSQQIAQSVPSLNKHQYREIVVAQTRQTLLNHGESQRTADDKAKKVHTAFTSVGIKQTEDEKATSITVEERKSTFRYSIDFDNDVDLVNLATPSKHNVDVEVKTTTPIVVELISKDGNVMVSLYVDEKESIPLYSEDGNAFVLRITGVEVFSEKSSGAEKYTLSFKAVAEELDTPKIIDRTITRIEDAYERSNLATVLSMCYLDGEKMSIEDIIYYSVGAHVNDSCAGCDGKEESVDTAKTAIAELLLHDFDAYEELDALKGTTMDLELFRYIEQDDAIFLKLRIRISVEGMDIYNGFTFLKLEHKTEDYSQMTEQEQALSKLTALLTTGNYYITETNTNELFQAFGDTAGNISSSSDLPSLYKLWFEHETVVKDMSIKLMALDETKALVMGHSHEKIKGFVKYISRYNLSSVKQQKARLEQDLLACNLITSVAEPIYTLYGLISDPITGIGDAVFSGNEKIEAVWTIAKGVVDPAGTAVDVAVGILFDGIKSEGEILVRKIAVLEGVIQELYKKL